MCFLRRCLLALGLLILFLGGRADDVAAHAALAHSDPPAGAVLPEPPATARLWFTEPLEPRFTRADVLDAAGSPIPGASSAVAPDDDHLLVVTLPADLPDGGYTVAWRNVSAADGHSLAGYFGFRVGAGSTTIVVPDAEMSQPGDLLHALIRGLALVGLAMVLAISPLTLLLLDPAAHAVPAISAGLDRYLHRYSAVAAGVAVAANAALLLAQSVSVAPDATLLVAVRETVDATRFGSLWAVRFALLLATLAALAIALRARGRRRLIALLAGSAFAAATTIPVSLISHAAAQDEGRTVAVFSDVLHLALAALWGGGVLLLAAVLFPALRGASADDRRTALSIAIPRFSAVGLAAWGVLVLTGIYASWLQVGTLAVLRETPYGQSLLLKGVLLLPILALAALHFQRGRETSRQTDAKGLSRSVGIEALLVIAVLLVVGRLIGQQPAREVMSASTPPALTVPLALTTEKGERTASLTISPGAAGVNAFTIDVAGPPLPASTEGVLRFALSNQEIGVRELRLPAVGVNRFQGEGDQLVMAGGWEIEAIVRQIGAFSWATSFTLPMGIEPPPTPAVNPAPRFSPAAVIPIALAVVGIVVVAVAVAIAARPLRRRVLTGIAGVAAIVIAGVLLAGLRLPPPLSPQVIAVPVATPRPVIAMHPTHDPDIAQQASPVPLSGPGTPVVSGNLRIVLEVLTNGADPAGITVVVSDLDGVPVEAARVAVISEMEGMTAHRDETATTEVAPGRYLARDAPFAMPGIWRLTVRISPRGEPTTTARFMLERP